MTSEALSILAPYMAGPGAAVLVLLIVVIGCGWIIVKHLVPLIEKFGDRHLAQIDMLIQNQQEEAKSIARALGSLDKRLALIESQLLRAEERDKAS
jgi:hypothetical protein